MILEFAALTSLTGDPIYEKKARKAMDFLWQQRHRSSDLMGTVLNVHSGDWTRRESGIGAGIDSYYEYTLKAYILLGDESYLDRFNKHYEAIKRYINKGPIFVDVHMHRPTVATRGFMDSLLAFWPGLQVLKGDVKEAIEMHEMLFQVIQKHKFLPEAFTHDFQVHWAEHPIRPEFVESTYFLYRATKDPHYLHVAKQIMDSINKYVKVPCGFAALKDIRTMVKEDQMESFVLSETFKYLYMIFTDPEDLMFDPDHYVLTTEAHFLPLSIGHKEKIENKINPRRMILRADEPQQKNYVCANPIDFTKLPTEREEAQLIRERTKIMLGELRNGASAGGAAPGNMICESPADRIRAWAFSSSNQEHVKQLVMMGIELITLSDGRLHLSHKSVNAASPLYARWGMEFMEEMQHYVEQLDKSGGTPEHTQQFVQILNRPYYGKPYLRGSAAQFGRDIAATKALVGRAAKTIPFRACDKILNADQVVGKIAVVERSDCVFQDKARFVQQAGAIGMVVIDHESNSQYVGDRPTFSMAVDKDGKDDIGIPSIFLFRAEGDHLLRSLKMHSETVISISSHHLSIENTIGRLLRYGKMFKFPEYPQCSLRDGDIILHNLDYPEVILNLRFNGINQDSDPRLHQEIVERHVTELQKYLEFKDADYAFQFYEFFRTAAYGALDLNVENSKLLTVISALSTLKTKPIPPSVFARLPGEITKVRCIPRGEEMPCVRLST